MDEASGGKQHDNDGEFYAELLRAYFDSANDAIFVLCNELKFLSCNHRMENWLGIAESELTRHNCRLPITALVGNKDAAAHFERATQAVLDGEPQCFECRLEPPDARKRWVEIHMTRVDIEAGEMVIVVARDTTERREQMAQIYYQSTHDSLTGLPNRASLKEFLEAHPGEGGALAVLAVDVPRFRDVNEALGHHLADEVLKTIADNLKDIVRQYRDTRVFRLAGDQFVVVSQGIAAECWKEISESVQHDLSKPLRQSGIELTLGSKIGVSLYPSHVGNPRELVQAAEAALHAAKQQTATSIKMFYPDLLASGGERLVLLNDLRQAIEDESLAVHLQPIVPLHGQGMVRLEALARWHHPDRGMVSPEHFIALAETSGQILPLTWLVIARALEQAAPLIREERIESVSINLSPYCLLDTGFTVKFAAMILRHGIEPSSVMLEITESIAMSERMQKYTVMSLRELGVELSIDDFGTGHSSLSKLRQLPVTELKIDQSFVTNMLNDENDEAIVVATIQLAHSLGLDIVAEGIEDAEVLYRLSELGCDYAQGRYICDALPLAELQDWLDSKKTSGRVV
ncbi:MAG TPA: sensor domain-containing phosphodiesterase [Gammaproteobacteria bacterium]|nr:sensor domain-containing phosphodiesterase [Gammaproteobacteria bacterium]